MEEINMAWERYVDLLVLAGSRPTIGQAAELSMLTERLGELHEAEAVERRYMANVWREYQPGP